MTRELLKKVVKEHECGNYILDDYYIYCIDNDGHNVTAKSHFVSLDNGVHWLSAAECMNEMEYMKQGCRNMAERRRLYNDIWYQLLDRMEPEISQEACDEIGDGTDEDFLRMYLFLADDDLCLG